MKNRINCFNHTQFDVSIAINYLINHEHCQYNSSVRGLSESYLINEVFRLSRITTKYKKFYNKNRGNKIKMINRDRVLGKIQREYIRNFNKRYSTYKDLLIKDIQPINNLKIEM